MWRLKTSRLLFAGVAAATALVGVGTGPSAQAESAGHPAHLTSDAPVKVVASGLNSPRSLVWGPRGHLIVSEVGEAPPYCIGESFLTRCYGFTSSLADVSSGKPVRIVEGLASNLNQEEVVGANGLAYSDGHLYVLETGSAQQIPAEIPADLTAQFTKQAGALLKVTGRSFKQIANPGYVDYEWTKANEDLNPEDFPEANPYALANKPGGGFYLVDAASNTLDSVDKHGNVDVLKYIPNTSTGPDAVPSCVAVGKDGSVYVGEITGKPSSATEAKVYKYAPRTGKLTVWQSGFSAISGCGFGANGDFYVTEFDTTGFLPTADPIGDVIQINHKTNARTVLASGKLFAPTGFLAGRDGSIYVANNTMMWPACTDAPACTSSSDIGAHDGEIVKIG
ncbi:ScyD/ScyE family protein [Streptomyces sp. NPDC049040]|uniref:ScyD/ScyE family protein n=1 Tax=Streptomyces sp. NPDC049040 TaxID=3365593 RepID=UPI00371489E4